MPHKLVQLNPTSAAVLAVVYRADRPIHDWEIQKALAPTPCVDGLDVLDEAGLIEEECKRDPKVPPRVWVITDHGREQYSAQRQFALNTARDLQATHSNERERKRYESLADLLESTPVVRGTPEPNPGATPARRGRRPAQEPHAVADAQP